MILFKKDLALAVMRGEKTVTRREMRRNDWQLGDEVRRADGSLRWKVGQVHAVCPGRGQSQIGKVEITGIALERVQNISDADVMAEGIRAVGKQSLKMAFAAVWDLINGNRAGMTWEDNPEVWVIRFRVVD